MRRGIRVWMRSGREGARGGQAKAEGDREERLWGKAGTGRAARDGQGSSVARPCCTHGEVLRAEHRLQRMGWQGADREEEAQRVQ